MKRIWILVILLFFSFDLYAQTFIDEFNDAVKNKREGDEKPVSGGTLRIRIPGDPSTLNPFLANSTETNNIVRYVYSSLITRDKETLEFLPSLASHWEVSDNGRIFTFTLREDVKWHDGVPFSADDVLFTFDMIKNEQVDCASIRSTLHDLKKAEKIAPNKIKFTVDKPYFLMLSSIGELFIFPKHRYQSDSGDSFNKHSDNRSPIGTGPYKFEKWEMGLKISLVKNKEYWGKEAYLDRLEWFMINNKAAALKELQNGHIDLDTSIEQDMWVRADTTSSDFTTKFVKAKFPGAFTAFIAWNLSRPYFQDKNVRKAFTMLIDREKILKEVHAGLGKVVSSLESPFGPDYDLSIAPYPYDPVQAKKILREAGWLDHDDDGIIDKDGVSFQFTLLIHNARDYHQKVADIVKETIEQAGILVIIKKIDFSIFFSHLTDHAFDAARAALATPPSYSDPFDYAHSSQKNKGNNFSNFENKEVDKLLEEARQTLDAKERSKLYGKLHRILHDEQPWTPLYTLETLLFYNKRFRNVKLYKNTPYLDFTEWYIPKDLQ